MEAGLGITDTSLPSDLWQKRKTGPTRKEAVCKDLVAKRGPQSHSHLHGFGAICHGAFQVPHIVHRKAGGPPPGLHPGGERRLLPTPTLVMPHN